tara:strand:+ start:3020 stop:5137 length:2118 start_codon:yes stop_codon:yes gene_type:complete
MKFKTIIITIFIFSWMGCSFNSPTKSPIQKITSSSKSKYDVRILRDTWGVPHIFGKTDEDVAFGFAYAHSEDDFKTIQEVLLTIRGKSASVFGKNHAKIDYIIHLMRVREFAEEKYDSELSEKMKQVIAAYCEGLNHYANQHPDEILADIFPSTPIDIVAGFEFKAPFFYGLDGVLKDIYLSEQNHEISEKNDGIDALIQNLVPKGSNSFAVSPNRTPDKKTRLAINTHQPWKGQSAWYEVHLNSEEGWNMVGGTFPGSPVVFIGHNENLGWTHTVNMPDLVDIYVLEINPENPDQYLFDGKWLELESKKVPIKVKLIGPFSWTFKREVLWSVHGPVIRQSHGTYAIRYAGLGEIRQIEQWYRMNKSSTFGEWKTAMKMNALPSLNTMYADKKGNIFYVYNAKFPIRNDQYDWSQYLPGNTSETLWKDYLPFDELPQVSNPSAGFLQNCNNTPFQTTVGQDNPNPTEFSTTLGIETHMTNRSMRAIELFGNDTSITKEEFYSYKFDTKYSENSVIMKSVHSVLKQPPPEEGILKEAFDVLKNWDGDTGPESKGTALVVLSMRPSDANKSSIDPSILLDRIYDSAVLLKKIYGRLDVPWKIVNRLVRGTIDLGLGGAPDILRAVYGRWSDKNRIEGTAGDCYIMMVEWNRNGNVNSQSIHQFGSATSKVDSPHFADQAKLFANQKFKPVWFEKSEILNNLESEYSP